MIKSKTLVDKIKYLFITNNNKILIIQKYKLYSTIYESKKYLAIPINTINFHNFEKDIHILREININIQELIKLNLNNNDKILLNEIYQSILIYHWCVEIHYISIHSITPNIANNLYEQGKILGEGVVASTEWTELLNEIKLSESFLEDTKKILIQCDDIKNIKDENCINSIIEIEKNLKELIEKDQKLKIRNPTTSHSLIENVELFSLIHTS